MKTRKAILIPQQITLRVEENRIGILYRIQDEQSLNHIDDTYIHFTPSETLMNAFEKEIEVAIKNHKK